MKIKNRAKTYFTKYPKKSIWFYIALALIFKHYSLDLVIFAIPMSIGLTTPDLTSSQFETAIQNVSISMTEAYTSGFVKSFQAGQAIGQSNPTLGTWLGLFLSYFMVYGVGLMMLYLLQGPVRYGLVWCYKKYMRRSR